MAIYRGRKLRIWFKREKDDEWQEMVPQNPLPNDAEVHMENQSFHITWKYPVFWPLGENLYEIMSHNHTYAAVSYN